MSETKSVRLGCPVPIPLGTTVTAWRYQIGTFLGGTKEWALRDESTGVVYSTGKVFDEHSKVRTNQPKSEVVESLSGEVVECTVLGRFEKSACTILVIRPNTEKEGFR